MTEPLTPQEQWQLNWDRRKAARAEYRASWPDLYPAVREAIDLGFWPDCYGGGPEPHGLAHPTKFAYPRAFVEHPNHADGPGAGSAFMVWSFNHDGTPDEIRNEPVWHAAWQSHFHRWLPKRGHSHHNWGLTFDEAIRIAIEIGDHMQANYLVPVIDPVTRYPILTLAEWREVAAVPLRDPEAPPTQLDMFTPPRKVIRNRLAETRDELVELLTSHELDLDPAIPIVVTDTYLIHDLVAKANDLRWEAREETAVAS